MGSPGPVVFKEALKLKRKNFKEAGASVFWNLTGPWSNYCGTLPSLLWGGGGPPVKQELGLVLRRCAACTFQSVMKPSNRNCGMD